MMLTWCSSAPSVHFSVNPIFAIARGNRDSQHRWCATRRENEEKETRETRERKRERLKTKEDIQTKQLKREVKKQDRNKK